MSNSASSTHLKTASEKSKSASSFKGSLTEGSEDLKSLKELEQLERDHEKSGYYHLGYKYVKPTREDYEIKMIKGTKLFENETQVKKDEENDTEVTEIKEKDASILVTGFGIRNMSSFQRILRMSEEERKKAELRKLWREKEANAGIDLSDYMVEECDYLEEDTTNRTEKNTSDSLSQTDTTQSTADSQKKHLEYLLGLKPEEEESVIPFPKDENEPQKDQYPYSSSKSMREAQKYLRTHRIFEFYQFIVAHMLSSKTDNPIEFILNLLNRCLLYRSGMGEPPLLYSKKHIEQLFGLMDKLKTGYIDLNQYKTGIQTLGICTYNENPVLCKDGLISKDTFINETYDAELDIFNDLIKRRPTKKAEYRPKKPSYLDMDAVTSSSSDQTFFIPSGFFKPVGKKEKYGSYGKE